MIHRRQQQLLQILWLVFCCTFPGFSPANEIPADIQAGDYLALNQLRFLADPEQSFNAESALAHFSSPNEDSTLSQNGGGFWIHSLIENSATQNAWTLAIPMPWLADLQAYLIHEDGRVEQLKPASNSELLQRQIWRFPLTLATESSAQLLLWLANDYLKPPSVFLSDADTVDRWLSISLISCYIGLSILLCCFLFAAVASLSFRSLTLILLGAYVGAQLLFLLSVNGLLQAWLNNAGAYLAPSSAGMLIFCTLFCWQILRSARLSGLAQLIFATVVLANLAALIAAGFGYQLPGYALMQLSSLAALFSLSLWFSLRRLVAAALALALSLLAISYGLLFFASADLTGLPLNQAPSMLASVTATLLLTCIAFVAARQSERTTQAARLLQNNAKLRDQVHEEFVAAVSTEVRKPLQLMQSKIDIVATTPLVNENLAIQLLCNAGETLHAAVDNLLGYSGEQAEKTMQTSPFAAQPLTEAVAQIYKDQAEARQIRIVTRYVGIPAQLVGPAYALRRILISLISNAVQHTTAGEVVVTLRCNDSDDDDAAELLGSVCDQGPGLSDTALHRLNSNQCLSAVEIESLAAESHRHSAEKAGLGLTIAQSIIAGLGGKLNFTSNTDNGVCVEFSLPVSIPALDQPPANKAAVE